MQIDFVSILLILGIGQCLFLIGTIFAGAERVRLANKFLLVLLLAFLWYQVEFFLIRHTLDAQIPFVYSTRFGSWLLAGPLVLLYNRAILIEDYSFQRKDGGHFLPFIILTLLIPLIFGEVITNRATHYGMLTVFDEFNQEQITWKHYLYGLVFILQFVHAAFYLMLSYQETNRWENLAKEQKSDFPQERTYTLKFVYLLALITIVLCSGFVLYLFLTTMWKRNMDYLYVIPLFLLIYGLAYRAMKFPGTVFLINQREVTAVKKYARSGLSSTLAQQYLIKLETALEKDHLYRNSELRLADLGKYTGLSTHHVSEVINRQKKQNFFDFINRYRVAEAKEWMEEGRGRTLLEVAFAVGFNSKNAFNTAFKKHTAMTPSAYKKLNGPASSQNSAKRG